MSGYDLFRQYIAMKLHFNSKKFDVTKTNGFTKIAREQYQKRNDVYFFEKTAKKLEDNGNVPADQFLIANFVKDQSFWIGNTESFSIYKDWLARYNSLTRMVAEDCQQISNTISSRNMTFEDIIKVKEGTHPYLFRFYLSEMIGVETMMLLLEERGIADYWENTSLRNDAMYVAESFKLRKYSCFFDLSRMHNLVTFDFCHDQFHHQA